MREETTMLERVAVAICQQFCIETRADKRYIDTGYPLWRDVQDEWRGFLPQARAAIEAMRLPTPEMVAAGDRAAEHGPRAPSIDAYTAMISAALSDRPAASEG